MKKNALKNVAILLSCLLMVFGMSGCSKSTTTKMTLKIALSYLNKNLPEYIGDGTSLEKVSVEGDYVCYYYSVNEYAASVEDFSVEDRRLEGPTIMYGLAKGAEEDPDMKEVFSMLQESNLGVKFFYKGSSSDAKSQSTLSPSELASCDLSDMKGICGDLLSVMTEVMNEDCPELIDEVTILSSVGFNGRYFSINYTIIETEDMDMYDLSANWDEIAPMLVDEDMSEELQSLEEIVNDGGFLMKYVYTGEDSGISRSFVYRPITHEIIEK